MDIDRRDFFKILGVAGAAVGPQPKEATRKLMPLVIPADDVTPGVANWYATVCGECPAGCGVLAKVREGRAIKVEGNPNHPINQGALCPRGQASLQGLYNPDRLTQPLRRNASGQFQPVSWEEVEQFVAERLAAIRFRGKARRIAFLTQQSTGSLDRLIDDWLGALGSTLRLVYETFAYEPLREANRICFDQDDISVYRIEEAEFLLSFGADFLETWLSPVEFARGFARMRRLRDGNTGRFIYIGPRLSLTAANADEWIVPKAGTELFLALGMLHVIVQENIGATLLSAEAEWLWKLVEPYDPEKVAILTDIAAEKVKSLARAFAQAHSALALGNGVATNASNATATAVAMNLLNYVTGNVGRTVRFHERRNGQTLASLHDLLGFIAAMKRGEVEVSTRSSDLIDGLMQPVMQPVFQTKAVGDVLLSVARQVDAAVAARFPWKSFYDYLRDAWREVHRSVTPTTDFESFWQEALMQGGVFRPSPGGTVRLRLDAPIRLEEARFEGEPGNPLLLPYPSPYFFDGRGANKPWLQELPDPTTKAVWGSWVEVHPSTASKLGIGN
ncbi:MAG: molybdopterin-dependent oxidoreductase, partial [Nitrospinae bacterium]|nr:molybdopterin-dependent oxidoreductase [Nitrospinota bacterium]